MTEDNWKTCINPKRMLDSIPYRVSKRKWRLIAVAFCRRIWPLLHHDLSRKAVEAAEAWADGLIRPGELKRARDRAAPHEIGLVGAATQDAPSAATSAASPSKQSTFATAWIAIRALQRAGGAVEDEVLHQCDLIRDILGYPYRAERVDPRWQSETVVALANAIYAERAFDRMPILADALEETGCDNADILAHCRGDGPHVRGCWVVDLILGKS